MVFLRLLKLLIAKSKNCQMLNKIKKKLKNNTEIIALGLLLLTTILSTTYYNFNKQKIYNNYKNIINNVYFKKTINHFLKILNQNLKL